MAKKPDMKINPDIKPGELMERDYTRLKALLTQEGPPSFKGARIRYVLGERDTNLCQSVGAMEWKNHPADYASLRHAITLAFSAYWKLWEASQ